ncbi:MAG: hypothetical protein AAFR16_08645 [Pseudomonadota bacterium]
MANVGKRPGATSPHQAFSAWPLAAAALRGAWPMAALLLVVNTALILLPVEQIFLWMLSVLLSMACSCLLEAALYGRALRRLGAATPTMGRLPVFMGRWLILMLLVASPLAALGLLGWASEDFLLASENDGVVIFLFSGGGLVLVASWGIVYARFGPALPLALLDQRSAPWDHWRRPGFSRRLRRIAPGLALMLAAFLGYIPFSIWHSQDAVLVADPLSQGLTAWTMREVAGNLLFDLANICGVAQIAAALCLDLTTESVPEDAVQVFE